MSLSSMNEDSENLYVNQDSNQDSNQDLNKIKHNIPIVSMDDIFALNNVSDNNNDIIYDSLQGTYNITNELSNMNIRVNNLESMIFGKKYLLKPPKLRRTKAVGFNDNNYIKHDIYNNIKYKEENKELDELIERINKMEETVVIDKKITSCKKKIEKLENIAHEIMNEEIFKEN